jgi:hypothetical protein
VGFHSVQATVSDIAGNPQTSDWTFFVSPSPVYQPTLPANPAQSLTSVANWQTWNPFYLLGGGSWVLTGFQTSPNSWYLPWYDSQQPDGATSEIVMENQGAGEAVVNIFVQGQEKWQGKIPEGGREVQQLAGVSGGPVKIVCPTGQKLKVTYKLNRGHTTSEIEAVTEDALEPVLVLPWFESSGSDGSSSRLVIANAGPEEASVDVYLGDPAQPESLKGHLAIGAGAAATADLTGVSGGPLRIVCRNNQPLLAAQQLDLDGSASWLMATGYSRLDSQYSFSESAPAPDATPPPGENRLLLGNPGSREARVEVRAGGDLVNDPDNPGNDFITIPGDSSRSIQLEGAAMPVEVTCSNCGFGHGIAAALATIRSGFLPAE